MKSKRSYGFLITKEVIFLLPNFGFFSLFSLLTLILKPKRFSFLVPNVLAQWRKTSRGFYLGLKEIHMGVPLLLHAVSCSNLTKIPVSNFFLPQMMFV